MLVYLDNSATTRQYDEVTDLMAKVAKESFGNPSSLHHFGLEAEKLVKKARENVARAIGASSDEIYFTSCATESDNTVIMNAVSKQHEGMRIITTKVEHPAILEPARILEKSGFTVEYLDVDNKCHIDLEQLKRALTKDTVLISVMSVNNETGTVMPIPEIARIKDEFNKTNGTNILLHTDAVQALGKIRLDVNGSFKGVDLMSASAHKIHGPKGIGFLYIKKGVNIKPFMLGGGQEKNFRSGTENVPGIVGFGEACKLACTDIQSRIDRISAVKAHLSERLQTEISDIVINTPEDSVCTVLNVSFLKTRGEVILHTLEQDGIYVSTGSACSSNHASSKGSHVLNAMGLRFSEIEGAIRFSLSEFTTLEEIDYTVEKVKTAVDRFRKLGSFR